MKTQISTSRTEPKPRLPLLAMAATAFALVLSLTSCAELSKPQPEALVTWQLQASTASTQVNQPVQLTVLREESTVVAEGDELRIINQGQPTEYTDFNIFTWTITPRTGASIEWDEFTATKPGTYTISFSSPQPAPEPITITVVAPVVDRSAEAIALVRARLTSCINGISATLPQGDQWRASAEAALANFQFTATPLNAELTQYQVGTANGGSVTVDLVANTAVLNNPGPQESCTGYFD